jgi:hypothetical protein
VKLKALVKRLGEKVEHLDTEVEFIVVTKEKDSQIVAMDIEGQAGACIKFLKMFGSAKVPQ